MLKSAATILFSIGLAIAATHTVADVRQLSQDHLEATGLELLNLPIQPNVSVTGAFAWRISNAENPTIASGPARWGQTGDIAMRNDRINLTIQDANNGRGLFKSGGHLIDADVIRAPDEPAGDRFREMFPIINLRVAVTTGVKILNDGSKGGPAIVRTTGYDGNTEGTIQFLDVLGGEAQGMSYVTDYELEPGQPWVRIRTTITNTSKQTLTGVNTGDFLGLGASEGLFTSRTGFESPKPFTRTRIVAHRGNNVSYAYVIPGSMLNLPAGSQEPGTGAISLDPLVMGSGESVSYVRYVIIGRTLSDVMKSAHMLWGEQVHTFSGYINDTQDKPIESVRITLTRTTENGSVAVNQAKTNARGRFSLTAPPGTYNVVIDAKGRETKHINELLLVANESIELTLDDPAYVQMNFNGPVKITAYAVDSKLSLNPTLGDYGPRVKFSATGKDQWALPPGQWRLEASRGMDYELYQSKITLKSGYITSFGEPLKRAISATMRGWLAADFHQHTVGSPDGQLTMHESIVQNAAEGCQVAVITDHDRVSDPRQAAESLDLGVLALPGIEVSPIPEGHVNVFPIEPNVLEDGARLWADTSLKKVMSRLEQIKSKPLIVINHPRTPGMGAFQYMKTSPYRPRSPGRFDAIEVNESLGELEDYLPQSDNRIEQLARSGAEIPAMLDWFGWLNAGVPTTGIGVSDSHKTRYGTCHPRTYVWTGTNEGSNSANAVVQAIRNQRAIVANGMFLDVFVSGQRKLGQSNMVSANSRAGFQLDVRLESPSWVNPEEVTVFSEGRPVPFVKTRHGWRQVPPNTENATYRLPMNRNKSSMIRFKASLHLKPRNDTWYVVVARGSAERNSVLRMQPFSYTNPIYVDVDGGGWSAISAPPDTTVASVPDYVPRIFEALVSQGHSAIH